LAFIALDVSNTVGYITRSRCVSDCATWLV